MTDWESLSADELKSLVVSRRVSICDICKGEQYTYDIVNDYNLWFWCGCKRKGHNVSVGGRNGSRIYLPALNGLDKL